VKLAAALPVIVAVPFEKPTTKDFVWSCWGGSLRVFGISFCFNFIFFLLTIACVTYILLFFLAFRKPKIVPGKFQVLMESGIEFVREQITLQMIGPEGLPFLPLLATLFFFIFLGNILEVVPGVNFPLNSRIAFPIVMAILAWVVYNTVGIRRHGFIGYLRLVLFPPGIPENAFGRFVLKPFLALIEFISVILVRPLTLSVRLFANMVAGHFLLAVFFLGTIAMATGHYFGEGVKKSVEAFLGGGLSAVSFSLAVVLVGFEIFVAALQAFIFSVLTASYIAGAMAEEH
jgi:F-type H+-transporting ATPase subunit a